LGQYKHGCHGSGFALNAPWEELKKVILHIHPKFTQEARPGDVIVAENWGCGPAGSRRPQTSSDWVATVAESFGRIFLETAWPWPPTIVCPGVSKTFDEGDELELDLESARVRNITKERSFRENPSPGTCWPLSPRGIIPALRERLKVKK
jgi:3-isopropylmalate dehydratase small subunit